MSKYKQWVKNTHRFRNVFLSNLPHRHKLRVAICLFLEEEWFVKDRLQSETLLRLRLGSLCTAFKHSLVHRSFAPKAWLVDQKCLWKSLYPIVTVSWCDEVAKPLSMCLQAHRAAEGERSQDEPGKNPSEDGASVLHPGCSASWLRRPVYTWNTPGHKEGGKLLLCKGTAQSQTCKVALSPASHLIRLLFFFFCLVLYLKVTEMLEEAERERLGCPLTPEKPLIRLRVSWQRLHSSSCSNISTFILCTHGV